MVTPRLRAILVAAFALAGVLLAQLGVLILGTMAIHFWRGNDWALLLLPLAAAAFLLTASAARYTTVFIRA